MSRPSGALVADSPFLGSAIVRAYRAQDCKARGFRIFLHPTVTTTEGPAWLYADLQEAEKSKDAERELNFAKASSSSPGSNVSFEKIPCRVAFFELTALPFRVRGPVDFLEFFRLA